MDTYIITALTILVSATAGVLTISTGIMAVNRILAFTKHRKGIHQKQTRFQDLGTHQAVFRLTQTNDIPDMRYKTQTIQELMQSEPLPVCLTFKTKISKSGCLSAICWNGWQLPDSPAMTGCSTWRFPNPFISGPNPSTMESAHTFSLPLHGTLSL